jgi:hypothetical protein
MESCCGFIADCRSTLLINVYRDPPAAVAGSRLLQTPLGIEDRSWFTDPFDARRVWCVENVYMPVPGRAIGGIRAKVRDQKGFVSFCNQRDLEVLLGMYQPGELCAWLDDGYVGVTDDDWVGLACDDEDLRDDLYERELYIRRELPPENYGVITTNYQIERKVHMGHHHDIEELFVLRADMAPEGWGPDDRFETVEHRWMRASRVRVRWEKS